MPDEDRAGHLLAEAIEVCVQAQRGQGVTGKVIDKLRPRAGPAP